MSQERYESAISSIVAKNDTCIFTSNEDKNICSNTQHDDMEFIRDDDYMQAGIANFTACLNEELLCKVVTERAAKSKIAMESGIIFFGGFNDIGDKMFESSTIHAGKPKGITAENLSKVWRVLNEVSQQTLDVTTQLNNQDADSTLYCCFSTNDHMLRYKRLDSLFYTDTLYGKKFVSKRVFSMMQIFVGDKGFVKVYGMKY